MANLKSLAEMKKMAQSGSNVWKPRKKGEYLYGECIGIKRDQKSKKYKNYQDVYKIKDEKGKIHVFFASHEGIKSQLETAKIGKTIYIEFDGKGKGKNGEFNKWIASVS